ncbi:hypothetical protein [Streptomyces canus]|uniref:hypothetical protein n=1 Tax=Streptomyces canus TaxID=58343 RepID=UPI0030DEA81F
MPTMVVEIHVPLLPTPDLPDGSYPFPWIEEVEEFLSNLEDQGDVEVFDEGEEDGDVGVQRGHAAWGPCGKRCGRQ